jgi:hypothetical protein
VILCQPVQCNKYYKISTVKHNSCIFGCYFKMFLRELHVSTHLRGYHQGGIVMKLKMSVHKQLAYTNCLCTAILNFIAILAW